MGTDIDANDSWGGGCFVFLVLHKLRVKLPSKQHPNNTFQKLIA